MRHQAYPLGAGVRQVLTTQVWIQGAECRQHMLEMETYIEEPVWP